MISSAAKALATAPFSDILDDLASRFVLNIPKDDFQSPERVLFQIEQSWWFYEDFLRPINPALPAHALRHFVALFLRHCPLLKHWRDQHQELYDLFIQYKIRVPVCGAILLDSSHDYVALVKGWSSKSGWGFPRGKINEDEEDMNCAIREVFEETGYDIRPLLKRDDFIEKQVREQRVKLYIISNVPMDTHFAPQTRKEISVRVFV